MKHTKRYHSHRNTCLNLKPEILPASINICMSMSARNSYACNHYRAEAEAEEGSNTQFLTQLHSHWPKKACWDADYCKMPYLISFGFYCGVYSHELRLSVRTSSAIANSIVGDSLSEPAFARQCTTCQPMSFESPWNPCNYPQTSFPGSKQPKKPEVTQCTDANTLTVTTSLQNCRCVDKRSVKGREKDNNENFTVKMVS